MKILDHYNDAAHLLEELQQHSDFELKSPIDIDSIIEALGIKIKMEFGSVGDVGKIEFRENAPEITINVVENSFEPRKRFTLAHELGHFCLHRNEGKSEFVDTRTEMSRSGAYWDSYEQEANTFAAELLMPKSLIIEDGNKIISNHLKETKQEKIELEVLIELLAAHFLVSNPAMKYRLKNLGVG